MCSSASPFLPRRPASAAPYPPALTPSPAFPTSTPPAPLPRPQAYSEEEGLSPGPVTDTQRRSLALAAREATAAAAEELDEARCCCACCVPRCVLRLLCPPRLLRGSLPAPPSAQAPPATATRSPKSQTPTPQLHNQAGAHA